MTTPARPAAQGPPNVEVITKQEQGLSWWYVTLSEHASVGDLQRALHPLPLDAHLWGAESDPLDDSVTLLLYRFGGQA